MSPQAFTTATPTLTGSGPVFASIACTINGETYTTSADASGNWRIIVANPLAAQQAYTADVTAADKYGNISAATQATVSIGALTDPLAPIGAPGTWALAWHDEFTGSTLDTTKWNPLRSNPDGSLFNSPIDQTNDRYGLSASYVSVGGGNLSLRWDNTPITTNGKTYPYTAAYVDTGGGKFTMSHGYIEARVWFTDTLGLWPAFWLITQQHTTWLPEIDICEWLTMGDTGDSYYHPRFNYHYDNAGTPAEKGWVPYGPAGTNYAGSWHVYGLAWSAGSLQVYLDGKPGPTYTSPVITEEPLMVIFSASPDRSTATPSNGSLLVDYVRVWQ